MNILVFLVLIYLLPSEAYEGAKGSKEYCDPELCGTATHIGCNNDGSFGMRCKDSSKLIDLSPYKDVILDKHNSYRNQIAGGDLPGFEPASRMATMVWDEELARLAELNVKTCVSRHDECRNTKKFRYAGQNLAGQIANFFLQFNIIEEPIKQSIDSWFGEIKGASQREIDKFVLTKKTIGHFTATVNDRAVAVGCALLIQKHQYGPQHLFACNYAQTNVLGVYIYKKGKAASRCETGTNPKYPNLCSTKEPIDPNNLN